MLFCSIDFAQIKLDKNGKAVGVWYYRHGKKYLARASKEIVVSGGSYDSPKLLLLSGIGPQKELEKLGVRCFMLPLQFCRVDLIKRLHLQIKPVVNLPVGKNLHDHFGAFLMPFTTKALTSFIYERDLGIGDIIEYVTKGTGDFSVGLIISGLKCAIRKRYKAIKRIHASPSSC